jgi:hypothetical protein
MTFHNRSLSIQAFCQRCSIWGQNIDENRIVPEMKYSECSRNLDGKYHVIFPHNLVIRNHTNNNYPATSGNSFQSAFPPFTIGFVLTLLSFIFHLSIVPFPQHLSHTPDTLFQCRYPDILAIKTHTILPFLLSIRPFPLFSPISQLQLFFP